MKFKYHIVIGFLCLIFCTQSKAQFVTIPDTNFVNWLNANGFSTCMNGNQLDTTCQDVISSDTIGCAASGINNLSGIEYFDNLITLYCQGNSLTILPEMPLTLKYLNCSDNQLTSLPVLPESLQNLLCYNNQLSFLPQLPSSLIFLGCNYNQLTTLPVIPIGLRNLLCYYNLLTSLPDLPDTMSYLVCGHNPITALPALPVSLFGLNLSSTLITDLPSLPSNLGELYIDNNPSLKCLPQIPNLQIFFWHNTGIECMPNNFFVFMNAYPSVINIPICTFPSQPGNITGFTSICPGTTTTYSVSPVANTTNYIWTLPPGWTGASTSNVINVTSGISGGVISVAASNVCIDSTSNFTTLNVSANNFLDPPTSISVSGGNIKVCPGDNRTYTTPLINGVTYNWTVPPGSNIISGQGTNTINVSFTPNFISNGAISVAIVSGNCSSTARNFRVNRNIPSTSSIISGSVNGLCNSTGNIYSVVNTPGLTYQWSVPAGATITSGQGTNSIAVSYGSSNLTGSIIVKGVNACGAGNGRSLAVTTKPQNPINISGPSLVCAYQQNAYYTTTFIPNVVSYQWLVPPGATITAGQGGNAMAMTYGSSGGFVRVRTLNNCGAGKYYNMPVSIVCREGFEHNSDLAFPNPSNSTFTINNFDDGESFNLNIYNVIGEEVLEYKNINTPFEFGKELNPGIYIVNIQKGSERVFFKIIKQ